MNNTHATPAYGGHTTASLLTQADLADILRVSRWTVYRLVREGHIPVVRVGERLRFRAQDVEAYMDRNREPAP
jgi:putative molybdopterin biosynthesis protein